MLQASVLVTLGGCHLLDGLVARDSVEARKGECAVLRRRDCERFGAHLVGIAKSNSSRARGLEDPHLVLVSPHPLRVWLGDAN